MRLESRKKMGFYPTPCVVTNKIKPFLEFPCEKTTFFDPCCGEGVALSELAKSENAITYGVELDHARAKEAGQNLNYVICCDYQQTRISVNAFSAILLNPPYDYDSASDFECSERKEFIFLKDTIKYLIPTGVMIYIIPQHRLNEKIAKLLALHFEDICVFQFPKDEYQAFKQIVILAKKKAISKPDIPKFQELMSVPQQRIPEIALPSKPLYKLPEAQPIPLFKSTVIDLLALEESLQKSPLRGKLESLVNHQEWSSSRRPPLPLRTGHLALVLASGYLDGEVGDGKSLHIVKGRVSKEIKKTTEVLEKEVIHRETDVIRISVKILEPNGEIKILV